MKSNTLKDLLKCACVWGIMTKNILICKNICPCICNTDDLKLASLYFKGILWKIRNADHGIWLYLYSARTWGTRRRKIYPRECFNKTDYLYSCLKRCVTLLIWTVTFTFSLIQNTAKKAFSHTHLNDNSDIQWPSLFIAAVYCHETPAIMAMSTRLQLSTQCYIN